ncbi:MAG: DUF1573 domain-containing protein [Ferruginibacter sp.]|nr:DUF1573 domain-containing protein [Ferruginibacter sp.]
MKQFLFSVLALTFSVVAFAKKKSADVAKFTSETIDLGKIQQGNPTSAVFSVTNIGSEPLIIETASPTCGCTISDYTKEPIAAGKQGTIKATYNAANIGHFEKHLTVKFAGTDDVRSITIKGDVLSKDDYAKLKPSETQKEEAAPSKDAKSNKTKAKSAKS